jgi:hypothetical protein
MRNASGALFACFLLAISACEAWSADPAASQVETILEKLHQLVWPLGRFQGNLSAAVAKATERGGDGGLPRLYLVDVETGRVIEWRHARGGSSPAVCMESGRVYFLRGSAVHWTILKVQRGVVWEPPAPSRLEGTEARQLFACVRAPAGELVIWVRKKDGDIAALRVDTNSAAPIPDAEMSGMSGADLEVFADRVALMQSIRPDGAHAYLKDAALAVERPGVSALKVIRQPDVRFTGVPAWIGDSGMIVVGGMAQDQ